MAFLVIHFFCNVFGVAVLFREVEVDVRFFKTIPTKILLELFLTFLLMQLGFIIIFVIIGIFLQEFLSKMPITRIPLLIPYIFPFAQSFCGQFVMIFTCSIIYSRITQTRENLILQSSGISTWRMMFPSFLLAFLMSILCFIMADVNNSWGKAGIQRTFLSSLEHILYQTLATEKSFQIGDEYFIGVNSVEGRTLNKLFLTSKDAEVSWTCSADSAVLRIGPASQIVQPDEICYIEMSNEVYKYDPNDYRIVVKFSFHNLEVQYNKNQITTSLERTVIVSIDELTKMANSNNQTHSCMSLSALTNYIDSQKKNIESLKQEMALQSAICLQTGNWDELRSSHWNSVYYKAIRASEYGIHRAKLEPTRRLAFAFNCFFLTWVCAPLALCKGGKGTLLLICLRVMPLLFLFFPVSLVLLQIAKDSNVTPLILWLPHLGLFIFGAWLVRKAL